MKTILLTLIILFLFPVSTFACSYIFATPEEYYADNPIVFIGEITNLESSGGLNGSRDVTFDILKTYKGITQDEITLMTGANSALCGFDEGVLEEGQIWVIHSSSIENFNSLPANKTFETLSEAEKYMQPLVDEPAICTREYAPVCGRVDTGIRCITEPCDTYIEKTYSNKCMLEAANAELLYQGECRMNEPQNPIIEEDEPVEDREYTPDSNVEDLPDNETFWNKITNFFKRIFGF